MPEQCFGARSAVVLARFYERQRAGPERINVQTGITCKLLARAKPIRQWAILTVAHVIDAVAWHTSMVRDDIFSYLRPSPVPIA
jgi:hypothetical protein